MTLRAAIRFGTTTAIVWTASVACAAAQSLSTPPTMLPLHSAFGPKVDSLSAPSNERDGRTELSAFLPPPSNDRGELRAEPPLGSLPPPGAAAIDEPPPAPWFSLTPTYIPPGAKSGSLQQALLRATYLPRLGTDGFGMTDVVKQFTFAVPPFIAGSPILITPAATTHFLDGPATVALPDEVYSFELEFRYMKQATKRFGFDLAAAPSYFGDLKNDSHQAWRVTGRALGAFDWTPTLKLVAGALILGRSDYPALPAGGVIWKPSDEQRYEFIFPRPKFARRIHVDCDREQWLYVMGEFGGNTWAYDRPNDIADKFTYSDYRLNFGWQHVAPGGLNGRLELGWVFHREITLLSGLPGSTPPDTFLIRGELSY